MPMRIGFLVISLFISLQGLFPEAIGLSKKEIRTYMKENNRSLRLTKDVKGNKPYIKYEDYSGERTFIFRMDKDLKCKYVVKMYDFNLLTETLTDLDKRHNRINDSTWLSKHSEDGFRYELKKKKWFFSVIVKSN